MPSSTFFWFASLRSSATGVGVYDTTTLQQAVDAVAARLSDPAHVRWTVPELSAYVIEALRTFNALTGHFRDQGVFRTFPQQAFYDLASELPYLRGYHVTDRDLVTTIEYGLLEPPTPTVWTGSAQFTLSDVTAALQRRRDQFLYETGMVLTRATQTIQIGPSGRQRLPEQVMTVRRAAWQTIEGDVTPLHREDVWNFSHFARGWVQTPGRPGVSCPLGYSVSETPPLILQVAPIPEDTGTLDTVWIERGETLDPSFGVLMGIPDDWTWVVKYGALADLLGKDGLALDPVRGKYCEDRWAQGIQLAKGASVVWAARCANVSIEIGALTEADQFDLAWQGRTGRPNIVLLSNGTLVALSDVPDAGPYAITVDLVRNAPVPVGLSDFLQVGAELLDALYDYAVHLALFKEGMDGVQQSTPQLERFYRVAGVALDLDRANSPNLTPLVDQSTQDERQTARLEVAS